MCDCSGVRRLLGQLGQRSWRAVQRKLVHHTAVVGDHGTCDHGTLYPAGLDNLFGYIYFSPRKLRELCIGTDIIGCIVETDLWYLCFFVADILVFAVTGYHLA